MRRNCRKRVFADLSRRSKVEAVAWCLIGEKGHMSVYLDRSRALLQAPAVHGIVKALVVEERVREMLQAAYEQGKIDERHSTHRQ
jgi:hypothetical protein